MTTSRLTPDLIALDKGLNLQTAKIIAPPGSVLDSLNYEQVDFLGQKRIDGYVRYDGSVRSDRNKFYTLTTTAPFIDAEAPFVVTDGDGQLVGLVIEHREDDALTFVLIDDNLLPSEGQTLYANGFPLVFTSVTELADVATQEEQYAAILANNQLLRERVTTLPGPVAGLHWFNDRLFAVASVPRIQLGPSHGYMPNTTYFDIPVLDVDPEGVYLGTVDMIGTTGSNLASLFQSRSEQQAIDELSNPDGYGWSFVHLGWEVPFTDALSQYGALTALNLNRQGVGVTGPTSTAGLNGSAIALYQKVDIVGKQEQVNGWKTSSDTTSYALNPTALRSDDALFVYADAFFSWDGVTGAITADGITNGTLVEYPANATVEVSF